jgi:hypothetical protein
VQDQPVTGKLEWHDPEGDPAIPTLPQAPKVGTLVFDQSTWQFVYTPPKGFTGTVTFKYGLWGSGAEYKVAPATITIVIEPSASRAHHQPPGQKSLGGKTAQAPLRQALRSGSDLLQWTTVVVPSATSPDNVQPARVTTVIYATRELKASQSLAHSLRLTRFDENGLEVNDSEKPVSYELRDMNGDGRDDLVAVFELDWAELWDGQEFAVLSGGRGGHH